MINWTLYFLKINFRPIAPNHSQVLFFCQMHEAWGRLEWYCRASDVRASTGHWSAWTDCWFTLNCCFSPAKILFIACRNPVMHVCQHTWRSFFKTNTSQLLILKPQNHKYGNFLVCHRSGNLFHLVRELRFFLSLPDYILLLYFPKQLHLVFYSPFFIFYFFFQMKNRFET